MIMLINMNAESKLREKAMSNQTVSNLIEKRIVIVQFISGGSGAEAAKEYSYFTDILDLKVGDLVVVDTVYGPKTANISQIKGLSRAQRERAGRWVIQRVDVEAFEAKMERYNLVAEIEETLEEEMASQNRIEFYMKAAKDNPRIADLVGQLQGLINPQPALFKGDENVVEG